MIHNILKCLHINLHFDLMMNFDILLLIKSWLIFYIILCITRYLSLFILTQLAQSLINELLIDFHKVHKLYNL